jgi:hypothetical protein
MDADTIEMADKYLKEAGKKARHAAQKLIAEIRRAGSAGATYRPEVPREVDMVLYFDESHELTKMRTALSGIEEGLTADDMRTAYQTLCWALDSLRNEEGVPSDQGNLMAVFLSTTSHLATYSPSNTFHWSARTHDGKLGLQPPIVELPFDLWKTEHIVTEEAHRINEVCRPEFMVRFGRPLYASILYTSLVC